MVHVSSITSPFSRSLKTQSGSKVPVPASLVFTPPSGWCHLARAIIHSHTKWPMEEKLVTLEEQMTSDRLCSRFFTITEETSNCRSGPTAPAQTLPFQADWARRSVRVREHPCRSGASLCLHGQCRESHRWQNKNKSLNFSVHLALPK